MLKNHLTIAIRSLMRRKLFTFINLTGLAFGIAFVLLIGLFLYYEHNHNRTFRNIDRIYRLVDVVENQYGIDYRVRDAVSEKIPAVKNACLMNNTSVEVNHDDQVFQFDNMLLVDEAVSYIRKAWKEICPDFPFDLQFYDDAFAAMYRQEEKLAQLITIFAVLAVIISCMGIFGLAVFQSEQRVKEIGIRKVLGASVTEITAMLTKNFTKWVIVANFLAWPVAYFVASKWLENFAYRIEMQWWMFALAGGLALLIALLTVSTQALKSALANPVEALRYE